MLCPSFCHFYTAMFSISLKNKMPTCCFGENKLFFPMYFLVMTQENRSKLSIFQIFKFTSQRYYYIFCYARPLVLFGKEIFVSIDFDCLLFLFKTLFFARGAKAFNMDKTDILSLEVQFIDSFSQQIH